MRTKHEKLEALEERRLSELELALQKKKLKKTESTILMRGDLLQDKEFELGDLEEKKIKCQTNLPKPVFGTKEWAKYNENCMLGCSHDCKYCYAKAMAIRFGRTTPRNWKNEILRPDSLSRIFYKRDGRIMFPTSHDIPPAHLVECRTFLGNMLSPGNEVTVVTKPHFECIKAICDEFASYKDKILFRFTIGSTDSCTLKFWEPNAPDFTERLASLEYAYAQGFQTSVSCEPMLDNDVWNLIEQVSPFVTDSIWLGKANQLRGRLSLNGEKDPETKQRAKQLEQWQSDANIKRLYSQHKDNPQIKWKDSIKELLGLRISTKAGLDV